MHGAEIGEVSMGMISVTVNGREREIPFDVAHLDRLMEARDIDALVLTSKHNIRYVLGGYLFFFFSAMDALGVSRYLPAIVYRRGRPEQTLYVGNGLEMFEAQLDKFWTPHVKVDRWGTLDAMAAVAEHLTSIGGCRRIGVEPGFLPMDAADALRDALGNSEIVDATILMERLRALKTPAEIALLTEASERVVSAMQTVFSSFGPGATKTELFNAMKLEEVKRGMTFEYCLLTAGASHNRSPSPQRVEKGDVVSLDSGGNYQGYIGDLCRMGVAGEPDQELVDLLGEIEAVQQAARKPIRPGAMGIEILDAGFAELKRQPHAAITHYTAHGMGLVSHEAPRLHHKGPVPYPAEDADKPLQPGMAISIETTMPHPTRGYIKLEDTVIVTETGWQGLGDGARGWNRMRD
jgi:Xaa-Pro aminopeptidase